MPDQPQDRRPHLVLQNTSRSIGFTAHSRGGDETKVIPDLLRQQHGQALRAQLEALKPLAAAAVQAQEERELESGLGLQVEFSSQPDVELAFESLANEQKKIELLSLRTGGG